jgi:hypothetical protein
MLGVSHRWEERVGGLSPLMSMESRWHPGIRTEADSLSLVAIGMKHDSSHFGSHHKYFIGALMQIGGFFAFPSKI